MLTVIARLHVKNRHKKMVNLPVDYPLFVTLTTLLFWGFKCLMLGGFCLLCFVGIYTNYKGHAMGYNTPTVDVWFLFLYTA